MATTTLGNLLIHMEVDGDRSVITALQSVQRNTNNMNSSMNKGSSAGALLAGSLKKVLGVLSALAIIDKVIQGFSKLKQLFLEGVKKGLAYNAQIESLTAGMEALTGSQKIANEMTQEMVELAKDTPYAFKDFADGTKVLLSYGVAQEEVIDDMTMLGDISMGNTATMGRLALAFGQVTAKGKLQAEEVRQMVNAGFNPLQTIADKTGKTMGELTEQMRKGEISADMVRDAFKDATSEGGRFYESMEKLSNTFAGQKEKIEEYGEQFWGNVTKPLYDLLASQVLPKIVTSISMANAGVEKFYGLIGGYVSKLKEITETIDFRSWVTIRESLEDLVPKEQLKNLTNLSVIIDKVQELYKLLKKNAKEALEFIEKNSKRAFDYWKEDLKNDVIPALENFLDTLADIDIDDIIDKLVELKDIAKKTMPVVEETTKKALKAINDVVATTLDILSDMTENLPMLTQEWKSKIASWGWAFKAVLDLMNGDYASFQEDLKMYHEESEIAWETHNNRIKENFRSFTSGWLEQQIEWLATSDSNMAGGISMILQNVKLFVDDSDKYLDMVSVAWDESVEEWKTLSKTGMAIIVAFFKIQWDKFTNNCKTTWENTKKIIKGTLDSIIEEGQIRLERLKTKMSNAWNSIKTTVTNSWSNYSNIIKKYTDNAYSTVTGWGSSLKRLIVDVFHYVKTTIQTKLNNAKTTISNFKNTASTYMKQAKNVIKGIFDFSLYTSGKNLMGTLIDGIKSKFPSLTSAVSTGASIISKYLGWHSPTEEGAGKDSDKWMPNLMDMLASTMLDKVNLIRDASYKVGSTIAQNISGSQIRGIGVSPYASFNRSLIGAGFGETTNYNRPINITVNADSLTNGVSVGQTLVKELNGLGILTHRY